MRSRQISLIFAIAATCASMQALAAATVFTGTGGNNTSVSPSTANAAMTAFEAAIGGANNGSGTGIHTNGFRSINWDGVPNAYASPNLLPDNYFNSTNPHGVKLLTPGTGVAVSSTTSMAALNFGDINPGYANNFVEFSPQRLFAPMQSNIVQIYFYQPGTDLPAMVQGFGAVFNDVESANATTIRYYGLDGASLGVAFVPTAASGSQSTFVGVLFAPSDPPIGHVVITLGNAALGASVNDVSGSTDLVVMDDITYPEPRVDLIFADGFQ